MTRSLVDDPVVMAEAARSFEASLPDLDGSLAQLDPADLASDLTGSIAVLAHRFGWAGSITVRFAPTDLPRLRVFPASAHHHACVVRVAGARGYEVILNSSLFRAGNLRLLVSRLPVLVWLFGNVLEREPDFEADFTCMLGDPSFWPSVSFSACHEGACLIPDSEFFATSGYRHFRAAMEKTPPWESRIRKVFWRGSTSGIKRYWPPAAPDDVHWLPRLELCARAQAPDVAEVCDIGITALVQVPPQDVASTAEGLSSFMRPPTEKAAFAQFKAVIDMDGNSNAWSGLFTSLLTGACVIKIESEHGFRQWYYDRLKPWVHYVPVKADLSDFEEKVGFVLADDDAARAIGEAGFRFARSIDIGAEMSSATHRLISWART